MSLDGGLPFKAPESLPTIPPVVEADVKGRDGDKRQQPEPNEADQRVSDAVSPAIGRAPPNVDKKTSASHSKSSLSDVSGPVQKTGKRVNREAQGRLANLKEWWYGKRSFKEDIVRESEGLRASLEGNDKIIKNIEDTAKSGLQSLQQAIAEKEKWFGSRKHTYEQLAKAQKSERELRHLAKASQTPKEKAIALEKANNLAGMIKRASKLYNLSTSVDYASYWVHRADRSVIDTAEHRARHEDALNEGRLGAWYGLYLSGESFLTSISKAWNKGGLELYIDSVVEQAEVLLPKGELSSFEIAENGAVEGFKALQKVIQEVRNNPKEPGHEAICQFMNAQARLLELQDKIKNAPNLSEPERLLLQQMANHLESIIRHVKDQFNPIKLTPNEESFIKAVYELAKQGKDNPKDMQRLMRDAIDDRLLTHLRKTSLFLSLAKKPDEKQRAEGEYDSAKTLGQFLMKVKALALMGPSSKEPSLDTAMIQARLVPVIHALEQTPIFKREDFVNVEQVVRAMQGEQQVSVPDLRDYGVLATFMRNFPVVIRGKVQPVEDFSIMCNRVKTDLATFSAIENMDDQLDYGENLWRSLEEFGQSEMTKEQREGYDGLVSQFREGFQSCIDYLLGPLSRSKDERTILIENVDLERIFAIHQSLPREEREKLIVSNEIEVIRRGLKYGISLPNVVFGKAKFTFDATKKKAIDDIIWNKKLSAADKEQALANKIDSPAAQAYAMGQQIRALLGEVTPTGRLPSLNPFSTKTPVIGGNLPSSRALVQAKFALERLEAWVEKEKEMPGHAGLAAAVRQEILAPRKAYFELVTENEAAFTLSPGDQNIAHEIYNATGYEDISKLFKLPENPKNLKEAAVHCARILHQMEARVLTDPTNKQKYLAQIYGLKRQLAHHAPDLYETVDKERTTTATPEEREAVIAFENRYGQQSMWAHFFDSCDWALKNLKTHPARAKVLLAHNANLLRKGRDDPSLIFRVVAEDERAVGSYKDKQGQVHEALKTPDNLTKAEQSDVIDKAKYWMGKIKVETADYLYLLGQEISIRLSEAEQMTLGHLIGTWDISEIPNIDLEKVMKKEAPGIVKLVVHAANYNQKLPVLFGDPDNLGDRNSRIQLVEARQLLVEMNKKDGGLFDRLREQNPKDRELQALLEEAADIVVKEPQRAARAEGDRKQEMQEPAALEVEAFVSQPQSKVAERPSLINPDVAGTLARIEANEEIEKDKKAGSAADLQSGI